MKRVRKRNTPLEVVVRSALWATGARFRLHAVDLPGTPDIANRTRKKAIFVHGCFWHNHSCDKGRIPRRNRAFWTEKLAANRARDRKKVAALRSMGFSVLEVWECQVRRPAALKGRLERFWFGKSRT